MKSKWLYFGVAAVAIAAVLYPVLYSQYNSISLSGNPFECAPLIPCQPPSSGFAICELSCTIAMYNSTFYPGVINVTMGTTITWVNHDGFAHTATSLNSSAWSSPIIGPGRSFTLRLTSRLSPGTYYYFCSIHLTMIGEINIRLLKNQSGSIAG